MHVFVALAAAALLAALGGIADDSGRRSQTDVRAEPARPEAGTASGALVVPSADEGVRAQLTVTERDGVVRDVRLRITRLGQVRLDARVPRIGCPDWPGWRVVGRPIVRDLDGDGESEVVVDVYTGGAHCCTHSLLYRWRPGGERYERSTVGWGNQGYRLGDLDADGRPELSSRDDRFAARFTAYAASATPVRIWRYKRGRLLDVTRTFPREVERDAAQLWRDYLRLRRTEARGLLAAWVADQALLGRADEGWRRLEEANRRGELGRGAKLDGYPAGGRYLAALRSFLRRTGYLG
jgi:hypothetical protein